MVTRSALPQNYVPEAGTLLEGFESSTDWARSGGVSISNDTVNVKTGTCSLKLVAASAGAAIKATKTVSLDVSQYSVISMYVYLFAEPGHSNTSFAILLSSTIDFSKYASYSASSLHAGWNYLAIHRSQFTLAGGESWENTMIRIRVQLTGTDPDIPTASVDDLRGSSITNSRCLFTFDDGYDSVINVAYPILAAKSMRATCYIISGVVGGTTGKVTYMTEAQLDELYAAGWAMGNHNAVDGALTDTEVYPNQAAIEASVSICRDWLATRYPRAYDHFCYPGGQLNSTVVAALRAVGCKTARRTATSVTVMTPYVDYMYLPCTRALNENTTLAVAKTEVDNAARRGQTLIWEGHGLGDVADQVTWVTSDFQELVNYIESKRMQVMTIDEWYEGLTNPRYRSLPVGRA